MSASIIVSALRQLRLRLGITVAAAAQKIECTPSMVSHIEFGRRDPKLSDVERYADLLGCDLVFEPRGQALAPARREVLEAFRAELPHLTELELEVWSAELELRRRRRA
jgi:transcriptional regulator with XRE-family HTH domain